MGYRNGMGMVQSVVVDLDSIGYKLLPSFFLA